MLTIIPFFRLVIVRSRFALFTVSKYFVLLEYYALWLLIHELKLHVSLSFVLEYMCYNLLRLPTIWPCVLLWQLKPTFVIYFCHLFGLVWVWVLLHLCEPMVACSPTGPVFASRGTSEWPIGFMHTTRSFFFDWIALFFSLSWNFFGAVYLLSRNTDVRIIYYVKFLIKIHMADSPRFLHILSKSRSWWIIEKAFDLKCDARYKAFCYV